MPVRLAVLVALLVYFPLYAPQPLLPLLATELGRSESQVSLLMSATLLPLSVAPLVYGAVLSRVPSRMVLRLGLAGLGMAVSMFALVPMFPAMLGARFVQGLLLPAVLTAIMTALAGGVAQGRLQQVMSVYIAATILGGFGGRLLAGIAATWADWHWFFYLSGAALLAVAVSLGRMPMTEVARGELPRPAVVREVWRAGGNGYLYSAVFCLMFVFIGLLNYLPFRVTALSPAASELDISVLYAGYLMGVIAALAANRVIAWLGSTARAIQLGYAVYAVSVAGTLAPSLLVIFFVIFVFCGGMFLVHSIASAQVNRIETPHRGVVNGLYVSMYYLGAVLGSYTPGLVYERWGWTPTVAFILAVAVVGVALTLFHGRAARRAMLARDNPATV